MSKKLILGGIKALSEQIFRYKRKPDGTVHSGGAVRTNSEIRKYLESLRKMGKDVPASKFNRYALDALDSNKYPYPTRDNNMPDTADTFSSESGHVRPFRGMHKDPNSNYYFKNPPEARGIFPELGTGVERKHRRFPDAPTMIPLNPVVRYKDYSGDALKSIENNTERRPYYDI